MSVGVSTRAWVQEGLFCWWHGWRVRPGNFMRVLVAEAPRRNHSTYLWSSGSRMLPRFEIEYEIHICGA